MAYLYFPVNRNTFIFPLAFHGVSKLGYSLLYVHTVILEGLVAKQKKQASDERRVMTGMERLVLRVSSMINHPLAQTQRWVNIHQLDTDTDQDWDELLGTLSETPEIEITFSDDGSVTLRWEQDEEQAYGLAREEDAEAGAEEETAPF